MREHEIIHSAFQQAALRLREGDSTRAKTIKFARGEIFELDQNSILEYWRKFSTATLMEPAELSFHLIRAEVQCMACFEKYHPEGGEIHCPYCGSYGAKILAGEEFYLESIETGN